MTSNLMSWITEASQHAASVDLLVAGFAVLIAFLSLPVFILVIVFAVKYRRGKHANRKHAINRNVWLEVSWAVVPFLLIVGFYIWSTQLFINLYHPPADALQIVVVAKQWMWKFEHPGGQREINELHIPAGEPVKLTMASQDVIHSLYIPALRLKQDLVPGRYTSMWFTADKPGRYVLTCAEFCGVDHSAMGGHFIVMTKSDYASWLRQADADRSLVSEGAALFRSVGCSGCHDPASTVHAPPLDGIYGNPTPLEDGTTVTADDEYLRDSILLPQKQIAAGYPHIMPTFQNVLSEDQVLKLIAYIKSLTKNTKAAEP